MEAVAPDAFGPNKQKFRDRFAERYPDIDMNDEEAYYGALNAADDENAGKMERLSQLESDQQALGETFDENPGVAELFLELTKKDGKPVEMLINNYAQAFSDLVNDPDNEEYRKALAAKINEDLETSKSRRELEDEAEANIGPTLDALSKVGEEMGLSPDEIADAFNQFLSFTQDLVVDKVSEDMWRVFINGLRHDTDMESARIEGETAGRNAKIGEKLRTETPSALNMSSGGGNTKAPAGDTSALYSSVWDEE